jgi:hypothetical protein
MLVKSCSPQLRIAILNDEISLWENRLKDSPNDIPYLNYIRTTLKDRVKELEDQKSYIRMETLPYG